MNNKEYRRDYCRNRYQTDPEYREKVKKRAVEYNRNHPDKRRAYYLAHRNRLIERAKGNSRKRRMEVLIHYSGDPPICNCCGETSVEFLTIDHINGGGCKHRERIGSGLYSWLKNSGFPGGFRVLCYNCNQSLGHYGYCPHKNMLPGQIALPRLTR